MVIDMSGEDDSLEMYDDVLERLAKSVDMDGFEEKVGALRDALRQGVAEYEENLGNEERMARMVHQLRKRAQDLMEYMPTVVRWLMDEYPDLDLTDDIESFLVEYNGVDDRLFPVVKCVLTFFMKGGRWNLKKS